MIDCKDPAMTALRAVGYNVVLTPKSDLVPTQLIVANGKRLQRLGDLGVVFPPDPGQAVPKIAFNNVGPNISGNKTQNLKVSVGLSILKGLVGALGGSTLGITAAYAKAKSVQFEYSGVTVDRAQVAELDTYLSIADINLHGQAVREMLAGDKVFVITEVIKAKKLTVEAKSEGGASLGVDLPVVQEAVGANIKVSAEGTASSKLVYDAEIPLAFGFQAVRLDFDGTVYKTMKLVKSGSVVLEAAGGGPTLEVDGLVTFD